KVGESSVAGTARQVGPAIARADLYGFTDMLDAVPGCQTSKELGYGIIDTWDDLVGAIQEIAPTTLEGVNQRVIKLATTMLTRRMRSYILSWMMHGMTELYLEPESTLVGPVGLRMMSRLSLKNDMPLRDK
ncbi:hypothetical protein Tco_0131752, partial [Tanacetum coccineum]